MSRAEKILEDLSANVKTYHNALFGYIPIEYSDGNSSNDNGNSGGDDDDDDDEIDANVDANGGVNYGNSGGMMFRTGNEGNIGTTSDDDDNNGDIYI